MKKAKRNSLEYLFLIVLGIFAVLKFLNATLTDPYSLLWFCYVNLILLWFGLYFKNTFLISSVLVSSFISSIFYSTDILSFTLSGKLVFGVGKYLYEAAPIGHFLTYYHLSLLVIPLYVIVKNKKYNR